MNKPELNEIAEALKENFSASVLNQEQSYDFPLFTVHKKELLNILRFLYQEEKFQFRFLTTLCGIHYPGTEKPFALMLQVHSLVHNIRIRFKSFTTADDLEFDSLTSLF